MRKISLCGLGAAAFILMMFISYLLLPPAPQGIPIIEYHKVDPDVTADGKEYNVTPEEFSEQLDYLKEEGYTTITLLDFMKAKKGKFNLPDKPIILTFDDGYEDNYKFMLPIIEERGAKAVVFMVTNSIGKEGYLTWNELRDMQSRGVEIGSHTANHQPLSTLSREKQAEEMKLSKLLMEWNGLKTIFSFSYPNGDYDEEMFELLKENEYLAAVTGESGLNTAKTNPYALRRVNIPGLHFGLTEFRLRLLKAEIMAKLGHID